MKEQRYDAANGNRSAIRNRQSRRWYKNVRVDGPRKSRDISMSDKYSERNQRTANAHHHQEIEQIMVANQQCRRCQQLGVAATDKSTPEQQERHDKDQEAGTYCIKCKTQIADHDEAKEAEYGNCGNQRVRNSKGLNVAICSDYKKDNAQKQDWCFQIILQYSAGMRREAGGEPPAFVQRAGATPGSQGGVDRHEVALDGAAEGCHRGDAHDGDQADEHAVFDKMRRRHIFEICQ